MDPRSKLPVTQRRPHAEPGRDNGAGSATGTGTAPIVFGPPFHSAQATWWAAPGGFEIATSVDPEFRPQSGEGPERGEHRTETWREQGWRTLGRA